MPLRELIAHFGFSFDGKGAKEADKAIKHTKEHAEETGKGIAILIEGFKALASVEIARHLAEWVEGFTETATELERTSQATGLSTQQLQVWELGANEAGIRSEEFTLALRRLSTAIAGGKDEAGSGAAIFAKLGIKTKDASGHARNLGDVLPQLADKFAGMGDGAEKSALATELFGRSGARLIPLLNKGSAGVEALTKDFEALGGGFSPEAIERAAELEKQTARLKVGFDSLKSMLGVALLPKITELVEGATQLVGSFRDWAKETTLLETGIGALAIKIGGALATALAPFILPGLKFIGIFLAVDDLKGFLEGQDSEIGAILDSWFGDGTASVVRDWVADATDSFRSWLLDWQAHMPVISSAFSAVLASCAIDFDNFVLGIENGWNALVNSLGLKDSFKIDTTSRVSTLAADEARHTAATASNHVAQGLLGGYNAQVTAGTAPVQSAGVGPLRAPVTYQNSVQLNAPINVTVAPGTPAQQARQVAAATRTAVLDAQRAALQTLEARTAGS